MLRNVIFDLGNVLISFKPEEYLIKKNYDKTERETILSDIFRSREWLLLDNGDITCDDAIRSIAENSALKTAEITRIFKNRMEIFYPIANNIKLIPELKEQGFKLYFLSNFPGDIFPEVRRDYSFFSHFEGGIISADARCSKPDHLIYKTLLKNYSLQPLESLYIDDLEVNVKAALSLGMKGIFTHGSEDISGMVATFLTDFKEPNAG